MCDFYHLYVDTVLDPGRGAFTVQFLVSMYDVHSLHSKLYHTNVYIAKINTICIYDI